MQLLVPDEANGYRLAGDFHLRSGVYEITTNELGLRGPAISTSKPAGTTRIALLGGSSVFGYLVADGQEAARLLESTLRGAGGEVEVINAGVPGYNSYQMFLWLARKLRTVQPDEIMVYGGWNDFRIIMHDRGLRYIENNCLGMPKMYRHTAYWELMKEDAAFWEDLLAKSYLMNHLAFKVRAYFIRKKITHNVGNINIGSTLIATIS